MTLPAIAEVVPSNSIGGPLGSHRSWKLGGGLPLLNQPCLSDLVSMYFEHISTKEIANKFLLHSVTHREFKFGAEHTEFAPSMQVEY